MNRPRPRRAFAVALFVALPGPAPADETARAQALIRDASRALQAGNAPLFLAAFDRREMPRFAELREQVTALAAQRWIASSVASGPLAGGPEIWTMRVDWLLELKPRLDPGPVERRQATLALELRKRNGRWKIARLKPVEFFEAAWRAQR